MDSTFPSSQISDKGNPHVLILTLPAQGHTSPMMKLAYRLADLGAKVTFFIPEMVYEKLVSESRNKNTLRRSSDQGTTQPRQEVKIVPFPDGLETEDERRDGVKVMDRIAKVMPGHVEDFIKKANQPESDEKITCVIADVIVGWGLEISRKMGLKGAAFLSSAPEIVALVLEIPELIKAGIIDAEGYAIKNKQILLSPYLPAMTSNDYTWNTCNIPRSKIWQKIAFDSMRCNERYLKISDWILCNWFRDLDPSADDLLPNTLSIGPLLASPGQPSGNIFSEDTTSLSWLDSQLPGSVIYMAFGSTTEISPHQFDELALGLELMGRPFLWVVRSENQVLDGILKRIGEHGKVVQWAPQEKVLAHASIACFFTHCGWNSVIESIYMGVPMLCWPYGGDHLYSRTCVCDGWKIGLEVKPEENGMVTRHEIKRKVDELVSNDGVRTNALKLRRLAQKSLSKGGSSTKNLEDFVAQLKL